MIYLGDNQPTIYLGDNTPNIYLGDELVYPTGPFVGIKLNKSVNFKKIGGTKKITLNSSEGWEILYDSNVDWLTLSQISGNSGKTSISATTTENQEASARTTTLTAMTTDSAYSATCIITQSICTPIILSAVSQNGYMITATPETTAITDCEYDFRGITRIQDGTNQKYGVTLSNGNNGTRQYVKYISINTSTVTHFNYAFNEMEALEYLEFDCSSIVQGREVYYNNPKLKTLVINNCRTTGVTEFWGPYDNRPCTALTDVYINGSLPGSCDCKMFGQNGGISCACPNLSVDSLNRIIAALPTVGSSGQNIRRLVVGNTNINKLSAAELAVATDKGWAVV